MPSTLLGPEETGVSCLWPLILERRLGDMDVSPGCRCRPYLENCIVNASIYLLCRSQVSKGTRWMPWHQEPMKDAGACDIPRGAGSQAVIRGFPNGETWPSLWTVAAA